MDHLSKWIPSNAQVRIGLVTQGHIPTIEKMLEEGAAWPEIARAINWGGPAAAEQYCTYAFRRIEALLERVAGLEQAVAATVPESQPEPSLAPGGLPAFMVASDLPGTLPLGLAAVVFSTFYESPINRAAEVERALAERGVVGEVLFDLLMANGTTHTRYFTCPFDGKEFDYRAFMSVTSLRQECRRYCADFYLEHIEEVDLSLLSPALQYAVREGILI